MLLNCPLRRLFQFSTPPTKCVNHLSLQCWQFSMGWLNFLCKECSQISYIEEITSLSLVILSPECCLWQFLPSLNFFTFNQSHLAIFFLYGLISFAFKVLGPNEKGILTVCVPPMALSFHSLSMSAFLMVGRQEPACILIVVAITSFVSY